MLNWEDNERKRKRRLAANKAKPSDNEEAEMPVLRMNPNDANNFLKLAAALKIMFGRSVLVEDLERAKALLLEYLQGYLEVSVLKLLHIEFVYWLPLQMYPEDVKPNHHWSTHNPKQILDFGPVYHFWSFTNERLNKVLKSFTTNNHNGGDIEVSFFRAFCRDARLREIVSGEVESFIYSAHLQASKPWEV